jgi:hypothetical protein
VVQHLADESLLYVADIYLYSVDVRMYGPGVAKLILSTAVGQVTEWTLIILYDDVPAMDNDMPRMWCPNDCSDYQARGSPAEGCYSSMSRSKAWRDGKG